MHTYTCGSIAWFCALHIAICQQWPTSQNVVSEAFMPATSKRHNTVWASSSFKTRSRDKFGQMPSLWSFEIGVRTEAWMWSFPWDYGFHDFATSVQTNRNRAVQWFLLKCRWMLSFDWRNFIPLLLCLCGLFGIDTVLWRELAVNLDPANKHSTFFDIGWYC